LSSSETAKLRIATARDLFEALASQQLGVRLSVLAAICQAPDKAVSYGPHQGRDLVEELAAQLGQARDVNLRRALAATLAVLQDPRALKALAEALLSSHDMQEIMVCAQRLAADPASGYTGMLISCLRSHDKPLQARAAATVLAQDQGLSPADRVRVALLCDVDFETPLFAADNADTWLAELGGSLGQRARALLKTQGRETWDGLAGSWQGLALAGRAWLLDWGCRDYPDQAGALCLRALKEGPDDLRLAALQAAGSLPAPPDDLREAIGPYLSAADGEIRLAAARAMDRIGDVRPLLGKERDPRVQVALVPHLARQPEEEAAPALAALLESADWRVRGATAQALRGLGEAGRQAVESLREHPRLEVRAAAAQVLDQ